MTEKNLELDESARSGKTYTIPEIYDIAFDFRDIPAEVDFLLEKTQKYLGRNVTSALELACGPAYHTREIARRNLIADGIDLEPRMVEYTRSLIVKEMLKELKLGVEDVSTQIVCRDRYNELLGVLCNIATSMEKFGTEIRNLQRDEIGEVAEAFEAKKQVGSSTMPHKRNPITSEQICGLSRLVRAYAIPTYENAVQWHERDLCNSSSERFIIPHSIILTDWVVYKANDVFKNIKVFPERMLQNMEISKGLPMAESMMTTLIGKGMGRGDAHELMRKTALKATKENKTLKEVFVQENKKLKLLSDKEINDALNPSNYLGASEKIIEKVVKKLER